MTTLQILERNDEPAETNAMSPPRPARREPAHTDALPDVIGADLEVPLVDQTTTTYTNFDYAASAPCLAPVSERLTQILPYYASVHRGAGYASRVCTSLYETARDDVGAFVDARADDVVIFTRNTTDALNLLESCVPAGGEVVYTDIEHHANLLPWQRRASRCIPAGTTLRGTLVALRAELAARPAALLAITGASNVTGELLPLDEIVRIAHEAGARVAIDAAQLAPHRAISLTELGADYVALSGHKLYAPFGAGALIGRRDWLDAAPPYLAGGGAVQRVDIERTQWHAAPRRHEGGTPNLPGAVALGQACRTLTALPDGALQRHEDTLRRRLMDGLEALPEVRVHRIWRDGVAAIGVIAFDVAGYEPGHVAAYLSAEHGIGVRDGAFCAHPLLRRLDAPKGTVRASFGVGTTAADVDRLVTALTELVNLGPRWDYAISEGSWAPSPDPRPLPDWSERPG